MKRKGSDFLGFFPDVRGEQQLRRVPGGWLVDFRIAEAPEPLTQQVCGQTVASLTSGSRWLYLVPDEARHTLMVFLNDRNEPQWFYADICAGSGLDERGWPWTNDLYLDVVALVTVDWIVTAAEIIDQNDLDEALRAGRLSPAQAAQASADAQAVFGALVTNEFPPVQAVRAYLTGRYT